MLCGLIDRNGDAGTLSDDAVSPRLTADAQPSLSRGSQQAAASGGVRRLDATADSARADIAAAAAAAAPVKGHFIGPAIDLQASTSMQLSSGAKLASAADADGGGALDKTHSGCFGGRRSSRSLGGGGSGTGAQQLRGSTTAASATSAASIEPVTLSPMVGAASAKLKLFSSVVVFVAWVCSGEVVSELRA